MKSLLSQNRFVVVCIVAIPWVVSGRPAAAELVTKAWGDVGLVYLNKISATPVISLTLWLLEDGDKKIPLPINRIATGQAGAASIARSTQDLDPAGGGVKTGNILTPGVPPTLGSVGTRVTKVNLTGASANAEASITANYVPGPNPGDILGATGDTYTDGSASAWWGTASAAAQAGTDPFVLDSLAATTRAQLDVNLLSNYPYDPDALFGMLALGFSPDPSVSYATHDFVLKGITNLPNLENLFTLSFSIDSNSNEVLVTFTSDDPLIEALSPISAADFSSPGPGAFILDPDKAFFSLFFDIPAGSFGVDDYGSYGLAFDIYNEQWATAFAVPEASSLALATMSALGFVVGVGRRRGWRGRGPGAPRSRAFFLNA